MSPPLIWAASSNYLIGSNLIILHQLRNIKKKYSSVFQNPQEHFINEKLKQFILKLFLSLTLALVLYIDTRLFFFFFPSDSLPHPFGRESKYLGRGFTVTTFTKLKVLMKTSNLKKYY